MTNRVSVLIVNWNGKHLLGPCLEALQTQTTQPHEVIVVDNGSKDDSTTYLQSYPWAKLKTVLLDENRGFSGGNNAGYDSITGDIVALLNNDTIVDPDWIGQALPAFEDQTVGMVACKSLRLNEPGVLDKAGHLIYPDGLNRGKGTGAPDGPAFDKPAEALWPDGGAGFYRKTMLDEIGFFDDDFFLYGEDAELGMRARWAGWRCVYCPKSQLKHHHSASLGKSNPKKVYYIERNRIWVLVKTFPLSAVLISPWHTFRRYLMNGASLLSGRGAAADFQKSHSTTQLIGALIKAIIHGIIGIPNMVRKRKHILRRITTTEMKTLLKQYRISVSEITLQD